MMAEEEKDQVFKFLEDLRKSGVVNMLCAAIYIQKSFGFSKEKSHEYLDLWING